jgi:hypothetical protein
MSAHSIEAFRSNNAIEGAKIRKIVTSKFMFNLFMLRSLPMGFLAGLRVKEFTEQRCSITVPFKWLNQNPFRSTYFAVLSMAAEMSSGMIAMMHTHNAKPSISMLVTNVEGQFIKKAVGLTTFTCEDGAALLGTIEQAIITGEGQTHICTATGRSDNGEIVAKFIVTWSFKARSK